MSFLLPHRFKRIGVFITPFGFALWLSMQLGYIETFLSKLLIENKNLIHNINVLAAIVGFFSFLGGMYFIAFSKERVEDEMIQKTRLDSFQFAALIQIIFIIIGFLFILLYKDPGEGGLMLFFIAVIFIFWLCFIARFNYILHVRLK